MSNNAKPASGCTVEGLVGCFLTPQEWESVKRCIQHAEEMFRTETGEQAFGMESIRHKLEGQLFAPNRQLDRKDGQ